ncbi:MAG TPA: ATP-binding protein [Steroidobacteraceae bacterium]|jgi:PAS domain S-box-containing protein
MSASRDAEPAIQNTGEAPGDGLTTDPIDILDTMDVPVVVVGRDCKVARFNCAATETLGATSSDVGRRACDLPALRGVPELEQICLQVMSDAVPVRREMRDGDRWFHVRIAPYPGANSQARGAVLTFTNVTAFRASLGQAIYEREYTKTILNAIADPLVVLDSRLQVQTANRAFYDRFAVSREHMQGVPLPALGDHEWQASGLWRALTATLSEGAEFQTLELVRDFPKIGRRTVLLDARRLAREGNAMVLVSFRDITQRKHAEQALWESEARFRTLFESMDEGYCIIEMVFDEKNNPVDYRFLETNPVFEKQSGIKDAKGRLMRQIAPDIEQHWFDIYGRIALTGEALRFESSAATLQRHYEVSAFRVEAPELRRVGVIFNDITQRKKAEKSLRDSYDSAQTEIMRRERAEATLRENDRRKDEFLAILAHELRNPLAPIRQAAAISKAAVATDEQKRWSHEVIDRQVNHMALLLDDLLDISRVTRGTLELRPRMTDLTAIIATATETARPLIEAKRHTLKIEIGNEPARFAADPLRLAQVLSNLLTNAAKYTDAEGEIRLRANCSADTVTFSVSDNGIGIPPDALEEVFTMFSQVKSAQDRSEGGLGIGLALARGIVHLHRGTVEVRSDGPGLGSEFIVKLPRRTLSTAQENPATTAAAPSARRRVLIADDNRDAADSLAMLLRIDGHDVTVVHDGRQALATIDTFRPEVAVLDIGMPELNGYEVARHIRQGPLSTSITLIAVTGWGQASDKARAAAAGFNHHLTKPIEPDTLTAMLR